MKNNTKGTICSTCRWYNNRSEMPFCEKHQYFFPARSLDYCNQWAICNQTIIKIEKEQEE